MRRSLTKLKLPDEVKCLVATVAASASSTVSDDVFSPTK